MLNERSPMAFDVSVAFRLRHFDNVSCPVRVILTCGFFQSWKYDAADVRRELRWKKEINASVSQFLNNLKQSALSTSVTTSHHVIGIHVRCGDIAEKTAVAYGYTIPGRDYFRRAIHFVVDNSSSSSSAKSTTEGRTMPRRLFVVTSDDIAWTKANLRLEDLTTVADTGSRLVYSEGHDEGFDMALLAACDALILSTGTFGWWSAWLGRSSPVVYYARWPQPGSPLERIFRRRDFFPPRWVPLDSASFPQTGRHL